MLVATVLTGALLPNTLESIVTQTLVRAVQIRANLILGTLVRPIGTLVNVVAFDAAARVSWLLRQ